MMLVTMNLETATHPMPSKKSEDSDSKHSETTVKVDRDLANKAALIIRHRKLKGEKTSVGKYVSDIIRPIVLKDWEKFRKEMLNEGE